MAVIQEGDDNYERTSEGKKGSTETEHRRGIFGAVHEVWPTVYCGGNW